MNVIKTSAKVSGLLLLALVPVNTGGLVSNPDPASTYGDSVQRIQAAIADEGDRVSEVCVTRFYTHGQRTGKAVVLVHGLTNSPRQFQEVGEMLCSNGYNVLIVRCPITG